MINWNSYGQSAVDAINLIENKLANSPIDAWEKATISMFGLGTPRQKKVVRRMLSWVFVKKDL